VSWFPRIVVIATALVIVALVVPLGEAHGPMGGTEIVNMNLPADGNGVAARSPMPATSTVGTVNVKETSDDASFLDTLTTVLKDDKPTFGTRAVHWVLLYAAIVNVEYSDVSDDEETAHSLDDLFLHVCLRIALSLSQSGAAPHAAGTATAAKCGVKNEAVSVTITKTGSGYKAILHGTPRTSKPRRVRVSCTHTATGLKITEKVRKAKGKLAKATGPILGVGFASRSSSSAKLKIALGVR
jgi:hypothetical protein